ncbi:hypothetical protein OED01_05295 [Microbacterium sp. M28]|uniref:hypothetical protein n=1 Tax=Microbacterium sp. M28 TaxID=2962064 RepID=UPI0021F48402|nr:hypothetical protein [Microbacterium sp. M28]UYO98129.1 hypothetical protein OED01_05295 [Microbacterium sp. M28]
MYILLALIAACALGIGMHYLLPARELRGVMVTPGIATAAAAIIYTGMQWAGVGQDSFWLWLASIVGSLAVAALATIALSSARTRSDAARRAALGL